MQFLNFALTLALIGTSAAAPALQARTIPSGPSIIRPVTRSLYTVWTGAVDYNTAYGKIFKSGTTSDITTLLTFDFPAASAGKTCEFHFYLSSDPTTKLSGSTQFDLFTSLAPATQSSTTWPSGNLRDQYAGRLTAYEPGEATWVDGFPNAGKSFPCPAGTILGGELVGTGDVDDIEWAAGNSGAYIKFF